GGHPDHFDDDPQYRHFLSKVFVPMCEKLVPGSKGLDFGCGPGPALAAMFSEVGHDVALYDPCFAPDTDPLQRHYDFITCTEVVEHLHDPFKAFDCFCHMLKPGGLLGIMTCFQTDDDRFEHWHYRKDPTHVVFFRDTTFRCVADRMGWHCEVPSKNVVIMQKPV
ncbi:MAG: class I SAM-dependent methyltransferase, partial [Pseudomonadota bacterium]